DERSGPIGPRQEAYGVARDLGVHQYAVDRPAVREQGEEQHGEGRGHDQVGHIDDGLEELLSLQVQARVREPYSKQQRHEDLRYEVEYPENDRVQRVDIDMALGEYLDEVGKTDVGGAHLGQPDPIILEEAV